MLRSYPLYFLLGVLRLKVLHSGFDPFWIDLYVWCNIGKNPVSFFSITVQFFQIPFIEEAILSPLYIFVFFVVS